MRHGADTAPWDPNRPGDIALWDFTWPQVKWETRSRGLGPEKSNVHLILSSGAGVTHSAAASCLIIFGIKTESRKRI